VSEELALSLKRVCDELEAPRSTVYARRDGGGEPAPAAKRGPKTALSDEELLEAIRAVIKGSPFAGEGHRKVAARLRREKGIGVGRKRVLRLMRGAGLLAPQRARGRRKPRPHDGTIVPEAPNVLWGTDATMAYTAKDGWVWAFIAIDHHTAEAWGEVAARGDRFAALEPIYQAVRERFGVLVSAGTAPTRRTIARRLGKMPTTSVRRRISRFSRSWGFLDQICRQCSWGTR
jgi:putative transposase